MSVGKTLPKQTSDDPVVVRSMKPGVPSLVLIRTLKRKFIHSDILDLVRPARSLVQEMIVIVNFVSQNCLIRNSNKTTEEQEILTKEIINFIMHKSISADLIDSPALIHFRT